MRFLKPLAFSLLLTSGVALADGHEGAAMDKPSISAARTVTCRRFWPVSIGTSAPKVPCRRHAP